jgi:peptidoglycan/xylan/chitin deacetylase (PgdA/CDA1 family)
MTAPAHLAGPPRAVRRRRLAELVLGAALVAALVTIAPRVPPYAAALGPEKATIDLATLGDLALVTPGAEEAAALPAAPPPIPVSLPAPPPPPWVWDRPPSAPVPLPAVDGMAPVLTRVETTDPVVFLTIDDGMVRSPEALATFRKLRIPASLFLNDGPIAEGADWFAQMPGTVVESHSSTHPRMTGLSEAGQEREVCRNADLIEQRFGRRPVLFRPPFGEFDASTQRAAASCGMRGVVLWQEDVRADTVSFREVTQYRAGDIVLMHFRPTFVEEITMLRDQVVAAGLRFALLEDYVTPDATLPR